MKRLLTLTLIGLILLGGLFMAATFLTRGVPADTAAVDAANQLFASSHFVEAAQIYEQQIGRGVEDASTISANLSIENLPYSANVLAHAKVIKASSTK